VPQPAPVNSAPPTSRRQTALRAGLIFLLVVAAYLPVWHAGFIWDDDDYVTQNQTLRDLPGLQHLWFKLGATPQYYPLVHTTFWIEYHLWKLNPLGYHLDNVLLQALAAILLWRLLLKLQIPGAWLAAAIFAVHPVEVESVAWVTERKNVLSIVFYLLAALAWWRWLEAREAQSEPSAGKSRAPRPVPRAASNWRYYWLALFLFVCALWSKTVACSFPAAMLLLVWWKRSRLRWRDVWPLLPFFALGLGLGWMTAHLEKTQVGATGADWALSFWQRCLIAGRVLWFYAGKLVWPHPLIFIYPRWVVDTRVWWQWLFPAGAVGVVAALWALRARIGRGPLVAVLFFAGTLFPALSFINVYPMRYSFVADHFQYLAGLGLIVLAAAGLSRLPRPGSVLLGGLLLVLGGLTWRQEADYKDMETLWRYTIAKNPACWMAHNNLGVVLDNQDRQKEAMIQFQEALKMKSDYTEPLLNIGGGLVRSGDFDEAMKCFSKVLKLEPPLAEVSDTGLMENSSKVLRIRVNPNYVKALNGMGAALFASGRVDEAIENYRKVLKIDPNNVDVLNNLGSALASKGQYAEAIDCLKKALNFKAEQDTSKINLGKILVQAGKIDEAITNFQQMLLQDPGHAEAHVELGNALAAQHRYLEALQQCQEALRFSPKSPGAHYNLGVILCSLGKLDEAIKEYRIALKYKSDYPEAHGNLGVALASKGKLDEAIQHYDEAIHFKPNYAEAHNNLADALIKQGKMEEAKPHCLAAIQANPFYAEAHFHFGQVLASEGDSTNAIAHWRVAIQLKPNFASALNSLAWALATDKHDSLRNGNEAVLLAERASKAMDDKAPEVLDTLAAAYAEAGRFPKAVETIQKAIDLASAMGVEKMADEFRTRLILYKSDHPYRE
jgi:protein O-mannosyl-transferase